MELPPTPESTPKKIGNLLSWSNSEFQRLEEELMTTRLREMDTLAELKELRLKVSVCNLPHPFPSVDELVKTEI